jgi:hypothetical protein
VTGRGPVRKYAMRMRNRNLRNIRPSGTFSPEVTKSRDRKIPCPVLLFFPVLFFPVFFSRTFFLVVVVQNVGWGVLHDVRVL